MAGNKQSLPHQHLVTLKLDVDVKNATSIGQVQGGMRRIVPIRGGEFSGEKLNGKVLPGGADWVLHRVDGVMRIDVRICLQTEDDVLIYLNYQGRFILKEEAGERLAAGEAVAEDELSLAMVANFECSDKRYRWLNDVIAVGVGAQLGWNPVYDIYQIGNNVA